MSNEEIFKLIRDGERGRNVVAKHFYQQTSLQNGIKKVMSSIKAGGEDDFWDIFDLTIMSFFKKTLKDDTFEIEKNMNSYLFMIARNLWIQELRKRNKLPDELPADYELDDNNRSVQLLLEDEDLKKWLEQIMANIGEVCKQVLMLWAQGEKMKDIQEMVELPSVEAARKRKHDCWKKLLKYLDQNPGLKDLLR